MHDKYITNTLQIHYNITNKILNTNLLHDIRKLIILILLDNTKITYKYLIILILLVNTKITSYLQIFK